MLLSENFVAAYMKLHLFDRDKKITGLHRRSSSIFYISNQDYICPKYGAVAARQMCICHGSYLY